MLNPPVNSKFKDFSRLLSVFQVLFKASLIFKDFPRQSCIFKFFLSLCGHCEFLALEALLLSRVESFEQYKEHGIW